MTLAHKLSLIASWRGQKTEMGELSHTPNVSELTIISVWRINSLRMLDYIVFKTTLAPRLWEYHNNFCPNKISLDFFFCVCVCSWVLNKVLIKKKQSTLPVKLFKPLKRFFCNKCAYHETEIRLYIFEAIIESLLNLPQVEAFRTQ